MTDAFDEEGEPAYTIDQFLKGIEEQEMVISFLFICLGVLDFASNWNYMLLLFRFCVSVCA